MVASMSQKETFNHLLYLKPFVYKEMIKLNNKYYIAILETI